MKSSLPLLPLTALGLTLGFAACSSSEPETPPTDVQAPVVNEVHLTSSCDWDSPEAQLYGVYCVECTDPDFVLAHPEVPCAPELVQIAMQRLAAREGAGSTAGGQPGPDGVLQVSFQIADGVARTFKLTGGQSLRGEVIFDGGEAITLRLGSGEEREVSYAELDPRSLYSVYRSTTPKQDGLGQLELADYARDIGLYAHARRHYEYAYRADPSLQESADQGLAQLRALASDYELVRAREAFEKGEVGDTKKILANILNEFPEEPAAATATELLGQLEVRESERVTRSVRDRSDEVAQALAPAQQSYERALEYEGKGLRATKQPGRALENYESAVAQAERGRGVTTQLLRDEGSSAALKHAAQALDTELTDLIVRNLLSQASTYMVRTSYNDAQASIGQALAADPANDEALAMRARIGVAASNNNWWGWGPITGPNYGLPAGMPPGIPPAMPTAMPQPLRPMIQ